VLPTCFSTALVALSAALGKGFGLPGPSLDPKSPDKITVIWGASSSVSLQILQVARAAGITTIATFSPRNFGLVKGAGASLVLDYIALSVVEDLVWTVQDVDKHFTGIVDYFSEENTSLKYCISTFRDLGGGKLGIVKPEKELDLPTNIKVCGIFAFTETTDPFRKKFLTPALESGTLKCLPEPL